MARRPTSRRLRLLIIAGLALTASASATAGGLGGLGGLGGGLGGLGAPNIGPTVGHDISQVTGTVDNLAPSSLRPEALADARLDRLRSLVRRSDGRLEADPAGNPVVRGEVLAIGPTPAALEAARAAGFTVERQDRLDDLDLALVVLQRPKGLSAGAALKRLRQLDSAGSYDFNHVYLGAGAAAASAVAAAPVAAPIGGETRARVGLIDTGVASGLPVFHGVAIEEQGFAAGAPVAKGHGTATASLIAGRLGAFHGAAPGAALYVADIYGGTPAGGSAEALAAALAWMARLHVAVINVSLVGPANALVAAAVRAITARGSRIVAAVGNDGPAAPPAYPASYPEVIAVTAVDARGEVLPEAGHALHVDYAAPGSGLRAASLNGGLTAVRGTSFAAPIVAGELARLMPVQSPAAAAEALAALDRQARRGPRGVGRGVLGEDVRIAAGKSR